MYTTHTLIDRHHLPIPSGTTAFIDSLVRHYTLFLCRSETFQSGHCHRSYIALVLLFVFHYHFCQHCSTSWRPYVKRRASLRLPISSILSSSNTASRAQRTSPICGPLRSSSLAHTPNALGRTCHAPESGGGPYIASGTSTNICSRII